MGVFTNLMNWDPVAWMSVLVVLGAIAVGIFLSFKIAALIRRDAAAHKDQRPQ